MNEHYRNLRRLHSYLMSKGRESLKLLPPTDENGTVAVTIGTSLQSVNSLDYATGDAELLFWDNWSWSDHRLSWDPRVYAGISSVRLPTSSVWIPDIRPYNRYFT